MCHSPLRTRGGVDIAQDSIPCDGQKSDGLNEADGLKESRLLFPFTTSFLRFGPVINKAGRFNFSYMLAVLPARPCT